MTPDDWQQLSEWHARWLAADEAERPVLHAQIERDAPDLVDAANALVSAGPASQRFLEVPAFALAASTLADETPLLAPGAMAGPYRVIELVGRGGMGEVYRAADDRLGRDVALKVLRHGGDARGVERFLQEARATAALDHPNIVRVFDVGVSAEGPYLVTELLRGETLRERLQRGALMPADARRIAVDIARGLTAAHAAGLVHRDLKPENIYLTQDGPAKILDFGIAKLAEDDVGGRAYGSTRTGLLLLGTAGYLAPEQIRGDPIDSRTDLFVLGVVLFEMLTGQRAFAREHTVDTLAAILHDAAPDLLDGRSDVPADLPPLVARLLEKTPGARFQSAADLAWALQHPTAPAHVDRVEGVGRPRTRQRRAAAPLWLGAAAVLLAVSAGAWALRPTSTPREATVPLARFTWTLPTETTLDSAPTVSPDGRRFAFTGRQGSVTRVFVRDLESLDAVPIAGTAGAKQPFWSPDSGSIGFFANGRLMKVATDGGAPVDLAAAPDGRGGTWSPSGVIVFQPNFRDHSLLRVSADGGQVEPATVLDLRSEDTTHRWPWFLPDGEHFLYSVSSLNPDRRGIYVGNITEPAASPGQRLFDSSSSAVYVPVQAPDSGVLLTVSTLGIEARPFDPDTRRVTGDARTIGIAAAESTAAYAAPIGATRDVLAWSDTPFIVGSVMTAVDRDGRNVRVLSSPEIGGMPRLSPDGTRLARTRVDSVTFSPDIWIDDVVRETRVRFTSGRGFDVTATWSPDGRTIAYRTGAVHAPTLAIQHVDANEPAVVLPCPTGNCTPTDWSRDGRTLIVNVAGGDIWTVPIDPNDPPQPLVASPFVERDGRVSPDGRWLAYVSNESGEAEVHVRPIDGSSRRLAISVGGGDEPVWARDASELFYVGEGRRLRRVAIRTNADGGLTVGTPEVLSLPPLDFRHWTTTYEVSPDGRRVYMPNLPDQPAPRELTIVLGWTRLLQ